MKYAKKKSVIAVLVLLILMVTTVTSYAGITPRWSYLTNITTSMTFEENGTVHVSVGCVGDSRDVDRTTLTCELQQFDGSWKTIKTWTETEDDYAVRYEKTYAVAKNYSYRLKVTASVFEGSTLLEKVTGEYSEKFFR